MSIVAEGRGIGFMNSRIIRGRRATICVTDLAFEGEIITGVGEALCDPVDDFDPEIGDTLALSRSLESIARRLGKRANGLVKCADDNAFKSQQAKLPSAQARKDLWLTKLELGRELEVTLPAAKGVEIHAR